MRRYIILGALLTSLFCEAKDFGQMGAVKEVEERDLMEVMEDNWKKFGQPLSEEEKQEIVSEFSSIQSLNLPRATENRKHYHDPTKVLEEDIIDEEGNVVARKGQKFNPLHYVSIEDDLIFFDATDPIQVEWAKGQEGSLILTGGNPFELKGIDENLFFDQYGELTSKYEIKAVPALVRQVGCVFSVEEICL